MPDQAGVHPGSWLGDGVEEFKKLPPWGKIAVGVVFLGTAYLGYRSFVMGRASSANNAVAASQGAAQGVGASGGMQSPFGQIPSGPNAGSVPLLSAGISPIFDPAGNLIGWQSPGQTVTPTPTPTIPPTQPPPIPSGGGSVPTIIDRIRARFSQAGAKTYDKNTPGGVPMRLTPGGKVVGLLPYGSAVDLTGNPIIGPSNFGGTSGSDIWYKLSNGNYVSQYDITPTIQKIPGATQPPKMPKVQAN